MGRKSLSRMDDLMTEAVEQRVDPEEVEEKVPEIADNDADLSEAVDALERERNELRSECDRLNETVNTLRDKIDEMRDQLTSVNGSNAKLHDQIRELKMREVHAVSAPTIASAEQRQTAISETASLMDPLGMIEIAEVPRAGVFPVELVRPSASGKEMLRFAPKFDAFGRAHFLVPRDYAESLLANLGGRKYVLVNPKSMVIRVQNGRHGIDLQTVEASSDYLPVF